MRLPSQSRATLHSQRRVRQMQCVPHGAPLSYAIHDPINQCCSSLSLIYVNQIKLVGDLPLTFVPFI